MDLQRIWGKGDCFLQISISEVVTLRKEGLYTMTNEEFIDSILDEYYATVYQFAYRICSDYTLADDIAQETFSIAWEKVEELRKHENIKGWLYQTARFRMLQMVEGTLHYLELGEVADWLSDGKDEENLWILRVDMYRKITRYITAEELSLILQHYEEGYNYQELAEKYQIREWAMRKRFSRIREKLKAALIEEWS